MNQQAQINNLQNQVSELMAKLSRTEIETLPEEVNPDVAKAYAKKHRIIKDGELNIEEATKRLKSNYQKEYESIDGREMAFRNTKHLRMVAPKVMGLEMREQEVHRKLGSVESKLKSLENLSDDVDKLQREFTDLKLKMSSAVEAMAKSAEEMAAKEESLNNMYNMLLKTANNRSLKFILKGYVDKLLCLLKLK